MHSEFDRVRDAVLRMASVILEEPDRCYCGNINPDNAQCLAELVVKLNNFLPNLKEKQMSKVPFLPNELVAVSNKVMDKLNANGIPYKVIGGIAVSHHSKARMTEDVDFLIREKDVEKIQKLYTCKPLAMQNADGFTTKVDGFDIDFIIASDDAYISGNDKYHNFPVTSKESTILLKLQSGRTKDFADIVEMLKHTPSDEINKVMKVVKKKNEEWAEEFNTAAEIARLEMKNEKMAARKLFMKKIAGQK